MYCHSFKCRSRLLGRFFFCGEFVGIVLLKII
nr:MAG TPA: hypothetical protein [Caudoviricetes sp.]DAO78491.1 MAG TPA: hypothetical protein [Bacteriophage sp.]